ncbi:MAG: cobalt ABC transporter permease [Actinobacteria bacterium]|nr:MAG: cobalt ABC transporter permease [Actinomycetota bacterium]
MVGRPRKPHFTVREIVLLALLAALIVVTKMVLRMPIRVPGHSGVLWMAALVIGRGLVKRPWAGTILGFVSGVLAVLFVGGAEGPLLWVKYLAPGMVLDLIDVLVPIGFEDRFLGTLAGAIANCAKLLSATVIALLMGLPAGFLVVGLGASAVSHAFFGGLGGWLGSYLLRRLGPILNGPAAVSLSTDAETRVGA